VIPNPRPLLLVGTGGLAREVAATVAALNEAAPRWRLLGFLDDDPDRHGAVVAGVPVLGPPELVHEHPDAAVVLCTASPADRSSRYRLAQRLRLAPERQPALVHPAASLADSTGVAPGAVVLAGAVATADVVIGPHVVVMPACVLTHDDVLGGFATLASGVRLGGGVRVGMGAYLGAATAVREGCRVGEWSLVGMGSVVLRDIPAFETWWGAPARCHRTGTPAEVRGH
jgi:sugar O-acyltransferase (sialic acid O-acetyltransferase NeuD family)